MLCLPVTMAVPSSPTKASLYGAILFTLQQTRWLPVSKASLIFIFTMFMVSCKVSLPVLTHAHLHFPVQERRPLSGDGGRDLARRPVCGGASEKSSVQQVGSGVREQVFPSRRPSLGKAERGPGVCRVCMPWVWRVEGQDAGKVPSGRWARPGMGLV